MSAVVADLITEVRNLLRSYVGQHENSTYLTSGLTNNGLSISVNDGTVVNVGVLEIDDELIYVESGSGGTLTVPPYGRGYNGSVAASHNSGAQVLVNPFVPRMDITRAIAEAAEAVYPGLYQIKTFEFAFNPSQASYDLAADVDRVLEVSWQTSGPTKVWEPIRHWRLETRANTTAFPSGRALEVADYIQSGRTVRVVYAAPFSTLSGTTTLQQAGFQESHRDVLVFGAAWRLVQSLEAGRLQLTSAENEAASRTRPPQMASALARQLLAVYQQRLDQERRKLLSTTPAPTIRYTR